MIARLASWFAGCLFVAFAFVLVAGPLVAPAPGRPRPPVQTAGGTPAGPPPPDDPLDPSWTPPGGRWHHPYTFWDEAPRHPCMIGAMA